MKSLLPSNLSALGSLPFVALWRSRVLAILAAIVTTHAQAILDTNNNGLSDLWEKQHNSGNLFPNTFLATNDEDKDGWTNAKEAIAGTDPFQANPPDGIVALTITPSHVPGAFTLTWPTFIGKNYQLKISTDLVTWTNLGDPISTYDTTHSIGINTIQPDNSIPPKVFWRVVVSDLDTDGDALTDSEEHALNTDPHSSNTIPGIPDLWLAAHFSSILLTNGAAGINMYADPDGDGYTNLEEHLNGTNPNVSDAPTEQQWLIVKGDGPQGEARTRTKQITIPKGQTRLVVVAIASEEYPLFTEPDEMEQFDDLLTWNIVPSGQTPITGKVNVNDRHVDWLLADIDGQTLVGLPGPVHYEVVKTITAPEASNLTIDVVITATNIADEFLPSYVAVGLLQVLISLDEGQSGKTGDLIPSNKGAIGEEHYVSPKKTSEIPDEFVILKATGVTNDHFVEMFEWAGGEAHPNDPLKRHVKRDAAAKNVVKIKAKQVGSEAARINVWVVWTDTQTMIAEDYQFLPKGDPWDKWYYGSSPIQVKYWRFRFTIQPAGIITDEDRPKLDGENTTKPPGHGAKHHILALYPADHAIHKWDTSRQIEVTVANPNMIPKVKFPQLAEFANQPKALDVPIVFPNNPVQGNDDPGGFGFLDEDSNPYAALEDPNSPLNHQIGQIASSDQPEITFFNSMGVQGSTLAVVVNFKEFARLNLIPEGKEKADGQGWYRVSEHVLWHYVMAATYGEHPTGSTIFRWVNTGSTAGTGRFDIPEEE